MNLMQGTFVKFVCISSLMLILTQCLHGFGLHDNYHQPWLRDYEASRHAQYVTDDIGPINGASKCSWLPACICRDESPYTNGTYKLMVNCTNAGLKTIPPYIPSNTTVLTLDGNFIETIEPGIFKNLSILIYLDLSNNNLSTLSNGTFEGLKSLKTLELNNNNIRYTNVSFPVGIFEPLINLTRLNLRQNFPNITADEKLKYPVEALATLSTLKQLLIDGIVNECNNTAFAKLTSVESLSLSSKYGRCKLRTTSPGMFSQLKLVTTLDISNCSLHMVEENSFSELKQLNNLDLSFNTELEFKSLFNITSGLKSQKLRLLNLNNIHKPIGDCTRLTVDNMKNMQNMSVERLSLNFNRLAFMEEDAVDFIPKNITELSLTNNMLLPGKYVHKIFINNVFKNITYLTLAEQDTHIDILNLTNSETKNYLTKLAGKRLINAYNRVSEKVDDAMNVIRPEHQSFPCSNCPDRMNISKILLPETLTVLDVSGLRIRNELKKICFCEPNKITRINLERNLFWKWQGPITGLSNLMNLNLAWNSCFNISLDVFDNLNKLVQLNLTRNFIDRYLSDDVNGRIFKGLGNLSYLLLSDMKLRYLPPKIFKSLPYIKVIDLSYNFLTEFDVDLSEASRLYFLNIHKNSLKKLEANVMTRLTENAKNFTVYVDMAGNTLSCTCNDTDFIKWFYETKVNFKDYNRYMCTYENSKLLNMSENLDLHDRLQKDCANYSTLILITSSTFVLFLIVCLFAICYRYRWDVRYFYYSAKLRMNGKVPLIDRKDENATFNFDAFISYSRENGKWVKDVLVPELEEKRKLKLLVHDRDFLAGNFVNDNIMGAITTSRKTLIVMSRTFLRSKWCLFEMNMARMEAITCGRNVICVIMKEKVPDVNMSLEIMDTIRRSTYLELDTNPERQDVFWDRVRDALQN